MVYKYFTLFALTDNCVPCYSGKLPVLH